MLGYARRAGSGFDVGDGAHVHGLGPGRGPVAGAEAIARCDALAAEAAGQRAAELNLRGCRAVLMAMTGRYDEAARHGARPAPGSPSCSSA